MGYMTVFSVLNDASESVKKHPEQVAKNVYEAMLGVGMHETLSNDFSIGSYSNPMKAVSPSHADTPQLVLAYQNDLVRFGYASSLKKENDLEYRKRLLQVVKNIVRQEEEIIKEIEEKIAKKEA